MTNSDQNNYGLMNFYERYETFPDDRILEILRNHKNYQDAAVNAAVKIAVERQLIHSEQDLLSPEFQNQKKVGFTPFPLIENIYHRQRLIASIFRFLYVFSLVPFIYGFLKYGEGFIDQTYLGIGVGLAWLIFSILLNKTRKMIVFIPLFALLFAVGVLTGLKVFAAATLPILDLVMFFVGILLPAYLMLYLRILIRTNPENN